MSIDPVPVDVAIVGGGPAGATLAALLAARGVRVVVIDAGARRGPPFEVLPPTAVPVLEALGLVSELEASPCLASVCLGVVKSWGSVEERHEYLADVGGRGWVVDRRRFDEVLSCRAQRSGAQWLAQTRLKGIAREGAAWRLAVTGPGGSMILRARFLVDASGRGRAVTRRLGIAPERSSRLRATWSGAGEGLRWDGPCWLHVSTERDAWSYVLRDSQSQLCEVVLSTHAPPIAGGETQHVAAGAQVLSQCVGDGWAAVGDAAAAFDPITSQGIANALASARALVPAVEAALVGSADAERLLCHYADAVQRTFRNAERGAREVYSTAFRNVGGTFWERMCGNAAL